MPSHFIAVEIFGDNVNEQEKEGEFEIELEIEDTEEEKDELRDAEKKENHFFTILLNVNFIQVP
jgi:hypothetical protein